MLHDGEWLRDGVPYLTNGYQTFLPGRFNGNDVLSELSKSHHDLSPYALPSFSSNANNQILLDHDGHHYSSSRKGLPLIRQCFSDAFSCGEVGKGKIGWGRF